MLTTEEDTQDFFLWWMPNRLVDIAAGVAKPPPGIGHPFDIATEDGFNRALWLMHLSGYYLGVWGRKNMQEFDGPRNLNTASDDDSVSGLYDGIADARKAANGDSAEEVFEYNLASLRGDPSSSGPTYAAIPASLVGWYAYNSGFFDATIPPGVNSPTNAKPPSPDYFTWSPANLLDATYYIPEGGFLEMARSQFAGASSAGGETATRLDRAVSGSGSEESLVMHQERYANSGQALWVGIPGVTVIRGWNQEEYDEVLTCTAYIIQYTQAAALGSLAAYATKNEALGRQSARMGALFDIEIGMYGNGISDPSSDERTPTMDDAMPDFVYSQVSRGCVNYRAGVRGKRLGAARLGRKRAGLRRLFTGARLSSRKRFDRYCIAGGGSLRIGYTRRGRAALLLTDSKRYRLKGLTAGSRVSALRKRLRGERRLRIGRNVWYLARGGSSTLVFKTRGGRVREIGLASKRRREVAARGGSCAVEMGVTRFGTGVAIAVTALFVGAATPALAGPQPVVTGMELTDYPWAPSLTTKHGVIRDQALLDAFAREYGNNPRETVHGRITTEVLNPEEFFNFWLPNRLYNIAMGTEPPPPGTDLDMSTDEGLGRALWLAHLNGYYGGIWLRNDFDRFDGDGEKTGKDDQPSGPEPDEEQLSATYARVVDEPRKMANHGSDEAVVEYSRFALRGRLPTPSSDVIALVVPANDEVGMFGFDATYLRYLLPPYPNKAPDTKPPIEPYFTLDETQLLTATYSTPEEPFLKQARANFARIEATGGDATTRRTVAEVGTPGEEPLLEHQNRLGSLATGLYLPPGATGAYPGFDQFEYDQLLSWTVAGVMINHANALNALAAYSLEDVDLGRRFIRSSAMWWAFTYLYVMGVSDPHHDAKTLAQAQPKFVFAGATRGCVNHRAGVRGRRLGAARLGRRRAGLRRQFAGARLSSRKRFERYCIAGGGSLRIGYRRNGRAVLLLTTSKRYRIKGLRRGSRVSKLRQRLRGERRFKVGRNTWYLAPGGASTLVFKTRRGRVREIGIADKRLTRGRAGAKRLLRRGG